MRYLDPRDATTHGHFHPAGPLPEAIRNFGRYPNTDEWMPGDILLFSDLNPSRAARAIHATQQRFGFVPDHARWQHAAIYIGEEQMCEAVVPRVRFYAVFERIPGSLIRVRRYPDLHDSQRYRIAINALKYLGDSYGWTGIFKIFANRDGGWRMRQRLGERHAQICSQLCTNAYAKTLGIVLPQSAGPDRIATPADLSQTQQLRDVEVCWRKIA